MFIGLMLLLWSAFGWIGSAIMIKAWCRKFRHGGVSYGDVAMIVMFGTLLGPCFIVMAAAMLVESAPNNRWTEFWNRKINCE